MPTLDDNIKTIQTAIYGKEMRPAISDALIQSWNAVKSMEASIEELNKRADNLPSGGGGTVEPDNPDVPAPPTSSGCCIADYASRCVSGFVTPSSVSSDSQRI